jgi:hypothetical protein
MIWEVMRSEGMGGSAHVLARDEGVGVDPHHVLHTRHDFACYWGDGGGENGSKKSSDRMIESKDSKRIRN